MLGEESERSGQRGAGAERVKVWQEKTMERERQRSCGALMVNSGFIPRVMEPLGEFKHESK